MKPLLALLLLLPITAFAASPEDDYIAARDKYIAQFKLKENEPITDAISKAEEQARAALEKQMQAIIGTSGVKGALAAGQAQPRLADLRRHGLRPARRPRV